MPAKPVSISFVAEVAEYLRATKKVEVSTEDIADALVAVSKDAKTLERDLNRAMRDAAKDPERLERVIEEVGDALDKVGDKAKGSARKMEQAFDETPGKFGQIGNEAGGEMVQNIGEAIGSGQADLFDLVAGTAGGLVSGLTGPVGVAAASAIGVVGFAFAKAKEKADDLMELAQNTADAISGMYEYGLKQATSTEELQAFNDWLNENMESLQNMEGDLATAGISFEEYAAALWAGGEPLDNLKDKLQAVRDTDYTIAETGRDAGRKIYGERAQAAQAIVDNLNAVKKETGQVDAEQKKVNDSVKLMADYLGVTPEKAAEYDDAMATALGTTEDVEDATGGIKSNLESIAGKTFTATIVIKPGDTYTATTLDLVGP